MVSVVIPFLGNVDSVLNENFKGGVCNPKFQIASSFGRAVQKLTLLDHPKSNWVGFEGIPWKIQADCSREFEVRFLFLHSTFLVLGSNHYRDL